MHRVQETEEGIDVVVRVLFVTAFIVIADQISKFMIKGIDIPSIGISLKGMQLGSSIPVIGDFLRIANRKEVVHVPFGDVDLFHLDRYLAA